jgi:hypothetical protein
MIYRAPRRITEPESVIAHVANKTAFEYLKKLENDFREAPWIKNWDYDKSHTFRDFLAKVFPEKEFIKDEKLYADHMKIAHIFHIVLDFIIPNNDETAPFLIKVGNEFFTIGKVTSLVLARTLALARIEEVPENYACTTLEKDIAGFLGLPPRPIDMDKLRNNLKNFALEIDKIAKSDGTHVKFEHCPRGTSMRIIDSLLGFDQEAESSIIQNEHEHALSLINKTLQKGLVLYLAQLGGGSDGPAKIAQLWKTWGNIDDEGTPYMDMLKFVFDDQVTGELSKQIAAIGLDPTPYFGEATYETLAIPYKYRLEQFKANFPELFPDLVDSIKKMLELQQALNPGHELAPLVMQRLDEVYSLLSRYVNQKKQSAFFDPQKIFGSCKF